MNRPCLTLLVVMVALCASPFPTCDAVRLNLQDLLQFYEQQQNPEQEQTEPKEEIPTLAPHYDDGGDLNVDAGAIPVGPQDPYLGSPGAEEEEEGGSGSDEGFLAFLDKAVQHLKNQGLPTTLAATTTAMAMTTETTTEAPTTQEPATTRPMSTCCRLGERAGRNKHHCNPDTYLPRMYRHRNRGHNFKQTNKHPSQVKTQLDKCVSGQVRRLALEFQTCCQEAYMLLWKEERGLNYRNYNRTHILEIPLTK